MAWIDKDSDAIIYQICVAVIAGHRLPHEPVNLIGKLHGMTPIRNRCSEKQSAITGDMRHKGKSHLAVGTRGSAGSLPKLLKKILKFQ